MWRLALLLVSVLPSAFATFPARLAWSRVWCRGLLSTYPKADTSKLVVLQHIGVRTSKRCRVCSVGGPRSLHKCWADIH